MSISPINDSQIKKSHINIETRIKAMRALALLGYFGTMAFLMLWIIKLAPPQIPKSIALSIGLLPLLLPLRGMIHGRVYTHSWSGFLALPYFAFGVDAAIHRTEKPWLGIVLVALSIVWFFGSAYYSKYKKIAANPPGTTEKTDNTSDDKLTDSSAEE